MMPFLDPEELKPKLKKIFETVVIPQIKKANMKQTAVEWLEDQYIKHSGNLLEMGKSFEQAKEMEKEQIMDAYRTGWINYLPDKDSEQYYNETFKSE